MIKNKVTSNNDLDDIFTTDDKTANKSVNADSAINQINKITKELDNCDKCFNSNKMEKQLIITLGNKCYLSIPSYEDLQLGHCLIVPIQHVSCTTELDEDVWEEINVSCVVDLSSSENLIKNINVYIYRNSVKR